jgi:hypothetical protein
MVSLVANWLLQRRRKVLNWFQVHISNISSRAQLTHISSSLDRFKSLQKMKEGGRGRFWFGDQQSGGWLNPLGRRQAIGLRLPLQPRRPPPVCPVARDQRDARGRRFGGMRILGERFGGKPMSVLTSAATPTTIDRLIATATASSLSCG